MINEKICYLELYDEVKEELKFLTNSKVRLNVLKNLSDLPIAVKDLSLISDLNYSAVLHNLHLLDDYGYLNGADGKFSLNNVAIIKLLNLMNLRDAVSIAQDYGDLWVDHDIACISTDDLSELSSLKRAYLVKPLKTDIHQPQNTFKKILTSSKSVKSILPYINPEYPLIFENLLKNSANIELLCEKSITQDFIQSIESGTLRNGLRNNNFKIKALNENINLFLTIADNYMFFGLCKEDGRFDQNHLLMSNESKAIDWASRIFEKLSSGRKIYI
jgi:predicted transcriptional regulator